LLKSLATIFFFALVIATSCGEAFAQGEQKDSTIVIDTMLFQSADLFTDVAPVDDTVNFENRMYQKPMVALVKSMVIPGLGQLGNHKPIKAVLFAGFDAWFIASAIKYKKDANDYRELWENETDLDLRKDYYAKWDDKKGQRNKYTWFAVITAFISMFDAYVDAHLSGFPSIDKTDNLSIELQPNREGDLLATIAFSF
jgi:hypothetical protein